MCDVSSAADIYQDTRSVESEKDSVSLACRGRVRVASLLVLPYSGETPFMSADLCSHVRVGT